MSKYGVISSPNIGKYGPEITPYLDIFHAVLVRGNTVNVLQISHYETRLQHLILVKNSTKAVASFIYFLWYAIPDYNKSILIKKTGEK